MLLSIHNHWLSTLELDDRPWLKHPSWNGSPRRTVWEQRSIPAKRRRMIDRKKIGHRQKLGKIPRWARNHSYLGNDYSPRSYPLHQKFDTPMRWLKPLWNLGNIAIHPKLLTGGLAVRSRPQIRIRIDKNQRLFFKRRERFVYADKQQHFRMVLFSTVFSLMCASSLCRQKQ